MPPGQLLLSAAQTAKRSLQPWCNKLNTGVTWPHRNRFAPFHIPLECFQKHDRLESERVASQHVCQLSQPCDIDDIAAESSCPADMHGLLVSVRQGFSTREDSFSGQAAGLHAHSQP